MLPGSGKKGNSRFDADLLATHRGEGLHVVSVTLLLSVLGQSVMQAPVQGAPRPHICGLGTELHTGWPDTGQNSCTSAPHGHRRRPLSFELEETLL